MSVKAWATGFTPPALLLEKAAHLLPDVVEAHYWLARTLIALGRRDDGQAQLNRVRELMQRKPRR